MRRSTLSHDWPSLTFSGSSLQRAISTAASLAVNRLSCAIDACDDERDRRRSAATHAQVLKLQHSTGASVVLWNKVLKLYFGCGHSHLADELFDRMPERDIVSFNTMITACARSRRDVIKVAGFYNRMRHENLAPNSITLSALLTSSSDTESPHFVEQVHAHAVRTGLSSNGFVGISLVNGYERCRGLDEAVRAFSEINELDLVCWNVMIDACARSSNKLEAVEVFSRMRHWGSESFDSFSLTSILKTCLSKDDIHLGKQLHCCALKSGLDFETPLGNALITMYSKCETDTKSLTKVFEGISAPNIISWTAIISGFTQNSFAHEAISHYKQMLRTGMSENEFCFASVLPACSTLARLEHGRQVHCRLIKSEFQSDVTVANALIDMYFKCGSLDDARRAFDAMRNGDAVSWTIMILGFGQHGKATEAIQVFQEMERRGFKVDDVTLLAVLSACSHGGLVDEGLRIFSSMIDTYGVKPRREHYACVIDMLGRAGRFKEAEKFIREGGMDSDAFAWEALLGACGIHGEKELGEKSAEKVMELEPERDGPYVLLSNIYAGRRMWEEQRRVRHRLDATMLKKEAASSWFSGLKDL